MKITLLAAIAAATIALTPVVASAAPALDSGSFTQDDGPSCYWNGYGSSVSMQCSGYSRRAGDFVSYSCEIQTFGSSSSWQCRSMTNGATWSGSR